MVAKNPVVSEGIASRRTKAPEEGGATIVPIAAGLQGGALPSVAPTAASKGRKKRIVRFSCQRSMNLGSSEDPLVLLGVGDEYVVLPLGFNRRNNIDV